MHSKSHHLLSLNVALNNVDTLKLPPHRLLRIRHPKDNWYLDEIDLHCHTRPLLLTRGIYLMEEWWRGHNITVSYPITENTQYCLYGYQELERAIRNFHKTVAPQQDIDHKFVVFGMGATQLLHAATYAICMKRSREYSDPLTKNSPIKPLYCTHQVPGYLDIKGSIGTLSGYGARWIDIENYQSVPAENLLEFVTSPNNPDGRLLKPITSAKYIINDRVNHWPFFMHETLNTFYQEDLAKDVISIFSLAKVLSFSTSRVGYALVNDPEIAHDMKHYTTIDTHGLAGDGEKRCLVALNYLLENKLVDDYINWVQQKFKQRWDILKEALKHTQIELLNSQGANFWVKVPGDARKYLHHKYLVDATFGPEYGVGPEYARLNMQCTSHEFNELLWRLAHPFN